MRIVLALLCLVTACGHGSTSEPAPPSSSAAPWTRAQWLTVADDLHAKMSSGPVLADADSRVVFARLVTSDAWLRLDRSVFEGDAEALRFFPTYKRLFMTIGASGTKKDLVTLARYGLDVYASFIGAGVDFVSHLPEGDTTRAARQEGLDKVRLGAAIEVCTLLYIVIDAPGGIRAETLRALAQPAMYATHSREGLQLIMATLDEKLLPTISPGLRGAYQTVREVVAREHDARPESASATRTTYQGMGPPVLDAPRALTIVSKTGGFSVGFAAVIGVEPLVHRDEIATANGARITQHAISYEIDEVTIEAMCFDELAEAQLVASMSSQPGASAYSSPLPGKWLAMNTPKRVGRMRIMTIGSRGCVASIEAPPGKLPAFADQFLASLKAAN